MQTHEHPKSGKTIKGTRLHKGAEVQEDDRYPATATGEWEPAPCAGATVQTDQSEIVRPDEPSEEAVHTLKMLAGPVPFWLKRCGRRHWEAIATPRSRPDPRVDLSVDQQCARELISYGFLRKEEECDNVYAVTDAAREFLARQ